MGKNKLKKFAELTELPNVIQCPYAVWSREGFPYAGKWRSDIFGNNHPIVLELGCGRGEYTLGLARRYPEQNFIGVDIKGNRIWNGAVEAHREGLENVRFLRTEIELLGHMFSPNEVDDIWLTFPDPQMKRIRKRLTSVRFLQLYRQILRPEGVIHLKSDSEFLYTFTREVAILNSLPILSDTANLYESDLPADSPLLTIRTYYESQWLKRGIPIKYLSFTLDTLSPQAEDPDIEIEQDSYRSYGRKRRSEMGI